MKSGRTGKRKIRTMRIFKGLENIHSVIDKHQAEWLREQGEEPERPERISVEERIRRSFAEGTGSGKFSADRFMGGHAHEKAEQESQSHESEHEAELQIEPSVEIVDVIPQKEERHSWLYNEVVKAIHDAAGDTKNTKIIAVFVPVVQNVKEFENLPVDETVTINQPAVEEEAKPLLEAVEILPEPEPQPEAESVTEEPAPAPEGEPEPELPSISEEFDLVPEGPAEPDRELAEAFQTIEDKLDESSPESESESELQIEQTQEPEPELEPEVEELPVTEEPEPLAYDEIAEVELPASLDDDEVVFDDAVFEEPLAESEESRASEDDSDEETIIIDENEEEELPDADTSKKED